MVLNQTTIEWANMRLNTIIQYKKVMKFMCLNCQLYCNDELKYNCIEFALETARENSDLKEKRDGNSD